MLVNRRIMLRYHLRMPSNAPTSGDKDEAAVDDQLREEEQKANVWRCQRARTLWRRHQNSSDRCQVISRAQHYGRLACAIGCESEEL